MWAERSERHGDLFVDVTFPPPRLIVFGAVDFAAALCKLAKATGWRPFVVDPRARFAQPARFPDAEQVVAAWPEEAFHQLGGIDRATAIAVLTHDPKLDDAALVLALRSNAGYIGAMGSRRAQAKRRERLLAKGIEEADLERVSRADRARPRLADRRGDRAVDHGRDRRHAARPRRRPAGPHAGADPRGRRVTIGGLILAAGEGRRFGGTKQLAELRGRPLLEYALEAMTGVSPRVVVLGHAADKIRRGVNMHGASVVECEDWDEGQSASLRAGLAALAAVDAVVVVLGDQPGITAEAIAAVVAAAGDEDAVRATYDGTPGHPVLLRRPLLDRAGELRGDTGFRDLLESATVREVEIGGLADPADIDTREELARR